MNEREGVNLLDFLATGINHADPVINAVLSDENGKGAVANEVEALVKFIFYYTQTCDVRNHRGRTLDMIIKMFAGLRRITLESDNVLLRRFLSLTWRKGDTIWGNALNIKNVLEIYFNNAVKCYIAEDTNERSILKNGDFEPDNDVWILDGGAAYSYQARFSGKRGLYFDGGAGETCTQYLETPMNAGNYTFHFFLYGKCGVIIENGEGKYWNANDQIFRGDTILKWVDDEVINIFEKPDGWDDAFCFIVLPKDCGNLTITFISIEGESASIDYARLFIKRRNPSYSLVFQYEGYTITDRTLHTAPDGEDPVQGVEYKNERYFDHSIIIGPNAQSQSYAFKSILDIVRPRGIQVFDEFLEKETVESEETEPESRTVRYKRLTFSGY